MMVTNKELKMIENTQAFATVFTDKPSPYTILEIVVTPNGKYMCFKCKRNNPEADIELFDTPAEVKKWFGRGKYAKQLFVKAGWTTMENAA